MPVVLRALPLRVHRDFCSVDTSMKRGRDKSWHVTNGRIGSAREYGKQFLLIRWFDREDADERDELCVLGNRGHKRSPASERGIAADARILCVSGPRHSPGNPKAAAGHGLLLADSWYPPPP